MTQIEGTEPDDAGAHASPGLRLVYFVHDLGDPAVARRLTMLRPFLESAVVIGFHRSARPPDQVAGWPAVALDRTADARLAQRIRSVLVTRAMVRRLRPYLLGANAIIARQLEMLVVAQAARRRFAATAGLAYECLDIHRLMVAPGFAGRALRWLEGRMLRSTDFLIVSSPAFVSAHLRPVHGALLPPVCLLENKVPAVEFARFAAGLRSTGAEPGHDGPLTPSSPGVSRSPIFTENQGVVPALVPQTIPGITRFYGPSSFKPAPMGPPWRIGWYGVLRCRRSLVLLAELTRRLPGQIVVELRGRPARSAIPDFDALVAGAPDVHFLGPYDRGQDLAEAYRAVHFAWAIDFYEAGANSRWLLPNRLYEGGLYGAVPIALAAVETGQWLAARDAGVRLGEPLAEAVVDYFLELRPEAFAAEAARLAAVARDNWMDGGEDGARLARSFRFLDARQ